MAALAWLLTTLVKLVAAAVVISGILAWWMLMLYLARYEQMENEN